MNKTVLILGAGQLGSRHLQGVKLSKSDLDIWVCDLSEESLQIARDRYEQVSSSQNHTIHFVQDMDEVPTCIDVAIVATGSKPRYLLAEKLLTTHNVQYLVLEKFLFTRICEYENMRQLIEAKNVPTYVNCTRRMWNMYKYVDSRINHNAPVNMKVVGNNWGLCCNSIHQLDMFMLLNRETDFSIDIDKILPQVLDSKRKGYVELLGTVCASTHKGAQLTMTSVDDETIQHSVLLQNGETHIKINEQTGEINIDGEITCINVPYQSALSGKLVDQLLEKGTCDLTPYAESAHYHLLFLEKVGPFINKLTGWTSDACPIT